MPAPLVTLARVLLGLPYLVLGLNHFFGWFPPPEPDHEDARIFMDGLARAAWVLAIVKGAEVVGGALLVLGWMQPLALLILTPVTIGVVGYAASFASGLQGIALPYAIGVLHALLLVRHRNAWRGLFTSGDLDE